MITSDRGIAAIKQFEGFRNKPYQDVVGKWTVGYGHLIVPGDGCVIGDFITPVQGSSLLRQDLHVAEQCINDNVSVQLTQNQFDALVSFVYNLGCGNFKKSTLLKLLNNGSSVGAANEFEKWDRAGGVPNKGIHQRRMDERNIFVNGRYPE